MDLITPPDDCHVNNTLSFSLQVRHGFIFEFPIILIYLTVIAYVYFIYRVVETFLIEL